MLNFRPVKEYKAYDIGLDAEGRKCIDLFKFKAITDENNNSYYRFDFVERRYPLDITEEIRYLRINNYHNKNAYEDNRENVLITNPIALMLFTFKSIKIKVLEKIYAPVVLNDMCYLISYAVYVDMNTGESYLIKLHNYGLWDVEVEETLKDQGYTHICDSKLIVSSDKVTNRSRFLKVEE